MKAVPEHYNKYWVAPTVAFVGGTLGFFTVKQKLENQSTELSNTATRIETELKEREFNDSLKNIYLHMKV